MSEKNIDKWKNLVAEILPLLISDVHNGLMIGPPPDGHIDDNCEDCQWYKKSLEWDERIRSGEFEELINLNAS